MLRSFLMVFALLAGACEGRTTAERKERADAIDIARVEAAQNAQPPMERFVPEPIRYADIEDNKLLGASCVFFPEGGKQNYVALAMADAAYIKIDGTLRVYAADKGSAPLPLGAWTHYEGREHVIDLQTTGGEGTPSGEETTDWPGRLTIRDPYDRLVYSTAGKVQCGA